MSTAYSPTSIVVIAVVLPLFSIVGVALRFLVRLKIQPSYIGVDDWLIVAAVVFLLGDCANLAVSAILGIQGHDYLGAVPQDRQIVENKSDYAQVILEKPMYALMKMSVLFFYRRMFPARRFLQCNTAAILLIAAWSVAYMLAEILVCGAHPQVLWTPGADPTAVCVNRNDLNFTYAITDVMTDILVVFMPFPVIHRLKMDRRQKIGVALIFLLGALSTAASIARLGFISVAFTKDYGAFGLNTHTAGTPPSVWSTIEGAVGVLAACLPPLGPLIRRAPHLRSIYSRFSTWRGNSTWRGTSTWRSGSYSRKDSAPLQGPLPQADQRGGSMEEKLVVVPVPPFVAGGGSLDSDASRGKPLPPPPRPGCVELPDSESDASLEMRVGSLPGHFDLCSPTRDLERQ